MATAGTQPSYPHARAAFSLLRENAHGGKGRAGEAGLASLRDHGPQHESDEEFEAFMDEAEAEALR